MTNKFLIKREIKKSSLKILILLGLIIPFNTQAEVVRENLGVEIVNDFVLEPAKNEVLLLYLDRHLLKNFL